MTHYIDPHAVSSNSREPGDLGARIAFENAYRVKKKTLISEIERALGTGPRHAPAGQSDA